MQIQVEDIATDRIRVRSTSMLTRADISLQTLFVVNVIPYGRSVVEVSSLTVLHVSE